MAKLKIFLKLILISNFRALLANYGNFEKHFSSVNKYF